MFLYCFDDGVFVDVVVVVYFGCVGYVCGVVLVLVVDIVEGVFVEY